LTTESKSYITIQDISFSYDKEYPLLQKINMNISKGECIGLSGGSGSGKSTLAQIIAGHLSPEKGSVYIDGFNRTSLPSRDVFLINQEDDLFPWLTVKKQIALALPSKDDNKVNELIHLTKLERYKDYYPSQLSGGMKKRLSIARALALDPKLLIFDESFSSLDFQLRKGLFNELKVIWKEMEKTIILISHDPRDFVEVTQREISIDSTF